MSPFAIFVIIVVIVAGLWGWKAGMVKQAGQIAGIILGIVLCRIFGPDCVDMVCSSDAGTEDHMLYATLVYIGIFIISYTAAMIVAFLLRKVLEAIFLGWLNSLAGAVFRITEWIFILSMILNLWESVAPGSSLSDDPVYASVLMFGPWLIGLATNA